MLLVFLSLRKLQEFYELCARNWEQRPIYISDYLTAQPLVSDQGHFITKQCITQKISTLLESHAVIHDHFSSSS